MLAYEGQEKHQEVTLINSGFRGWPQSLGVFFHVVTPTILCRASGPFRTFLCAVRWTCYPILSTYPSAAHAVSQLPMSAHQCCHLQCPTQYCARTPVLGVSRGKCTRQRSLAPWVCHLGRPHAQHKGKQLVWLCIHIWCPFIQLLWAALTPA